MRWISLAALVAIASCASPRPVPPPGDADATIAGRYLLNSPAGVIGTITSIVRCGSMLYAGDSEARIHRIDMTTGQAETPISDSSIMPMALAGDCERDRVWAISPLPRGRGLRAVAFDIATAKALSEISIPQPCFPTSAVVSHDALFVGGECIEGMTGDRYVMPSAEAYYADKRIGVQVDMTSGDVRAGLRPFETACHAGGGCVGGSIDATRDGWVATLRGGSHVALYARDGALVRTVSAASPAMANDGSRLPSTASAEQGVRWSSRNSMINRAYAIGDRLVVTHYLADVPPGWTMGGPSRPQFKVWMNVFTSAGQPIALDLRLPELLIGSDGESLYAVDYGPNGRQGGHESVTILRIAVPAS